ncbi:MAG TPA: cupin domain-containing protein [Rhizomicrobium sp.]|nr:cupin domain-containing protein [Rhizomicrobium sp.]
MPKIDIAAIKPRKGSGYPVPFHEIAKARLKKSLGDAAGLSDFGVNLVTLPPGAWSSQRHWHSAEDELVYLLSGELVLVTDGGEEVLRAGDCAAFAKGVADGHHLINRSDGDAVYLEVGSRRPDDACSYPDIDLMLGGGDGQFRRRDGTPYPPRQG